MRNLIVNHELQQSDITVEQLATRLGIPPKEYKRMLTETDLTAHQIAAAIVAIDKIVEERKQKENESMEEISNDNLNQMNTSQNITEQNKARFSNEEYFKQLEQRRIEEHEMILKAFRNGGVVELKTSNKKQE